MMPELLSAVLTWLAIVVSFVWLCGSAIIAWCIVGAQLHHEEPIASIVITLFWPLLWLYDGLVALAWRLWGRFGGWPRIPRS